MKTKTIIEGQYDGYRIAVQDSRTGEIVAVGERCSLNESRHLEVVVLAPGHRLNPIPEVRS